MKLYGLASRQSGDVDEWRLTRAEAEAVLAQVLADKPELEGVVSIAELELPDEPTGRARQPTSHSAQPRRGGAAGLPAAPPA